MADQATAAPTRDKSTIMLELTITAGDNTALRLTSKFDTDDNLYFLADHGISAICKDAANWTFEPALDKYNGLGTGAVTLQVTFSDTVPNMPPVESVTVTFETTGSLREALREAVRSVDDSATNLARKRKRLAAGAEQKNA